MASRMNVCAQSVAELFGSFVFAVALVSVRAPFTQATTYTWTGAAGNNLWSGSTSGITNWNPNTLPPITQSIAFTNTTSFPTVNLQTDRVINDVTFGGTQGYDLTGGTLTVSSGNITANGGATAATHEIDTPLTIGAAVPEPSVVCLVAMGLVAIAGGGRCCGGRVMTFAGIGPGRLARG
jgi:hypothetical protein